LIPRQDNGTTATLEFRDGTSATADLIIGCDGIHSNLRAQFRTDNPKYSGRIAYRGLVPIDKLKSWWPFQTYSVSWLGKDKHFLVFPISNNRTLNIVAFIATDESNLGDLKESWTATGDRDSLAKDFEGFEPTVRKIISLMPQHPSKWVLNDREPLKKWVFAGGKLVLMGDAAHAVSIQCLVPVKISNCHLIQVKMLPHQGAGAGQAIEDGYILGRAIKDFLRSSDRATDDSLERWAYLYQSVRLPRAQKAQATARQAGHVYEMQTEEMIGKSYEECLPFVKDGLKDRMKWVWTENIDLAYEDARGPLVE
jgi:2-polyprenyl-6-methoxyphenol hydroxylase-like FAD-dependent oxidoreductase